MQTHIQHELVGNCCTQMSLLMLKESFTLGRLMLNEGRQIQYQGGLRLDVQH